MSAPIFGKTLERERVMPYYKDVTAAKGRTMRQEQLIWAYEIAVFGAALLLACAAVFT